MRLRFVDEFEVNEVAECTGLVPHYAGFFLPFVKYNVCLEC